MTGRGLDPGVTTEEGPASENLGAWGRVSRFTERHRPPSSPTIGTPSYIIKIRGTHAPSHRRTSPYLTGGGRGESLGDRDTWDRSRNWNRGGV